MRVTLLGHASVLVELEGATCLMDPVFSDPFEEGTVVSCPRRTVYPAKLPPIDILIVSHRHPDHFDLPSLAQLAPDCDALCPADPLLVPALKQLGVARVHALHPMAPILSADFELYPTRSESGGVPEFGMVFKDHSGTFWNQVDTVLSAPTIRAVRRHCGPIDLLFAMYASQNFEFFESRSIAFPFEVHRQNLENVLRIRPRVVAPASAGFRFCGSHSWLNAFVFPISRARFVADLQRLDPAIGTQIVNPGDIFDLTGGSVGYEPGASEVAVLEADDSARVRFDPAAPVPPLADPNPDGYAREHLLEVTERLVVDGLAGFVREAYRSAEKVVALYRQYRARYQIAVVFPDSKVARYRLEFGEEAARLQSPAGTDEPTDIEHHIAASALVGWLERRKSFFYVRAYSRRFSTLYDLLADGEQVRLAERPLPDLLMHYLLNASEGSEYFAKHRVDLELQVLREGR